MKKYTVFNFSITPLLAGVPYVAGLARRNQHPAVLLSGLLLAVSLTGLTAFAQTATQRGVQAITASSDSTLQLGKYYALVIGNNNYKFVNKLKTAVNDADAVAKLLRDRYGFTTKILHDATRDDILTALNEYRRTLSVNSSLLIYYAGHGYKDPDTAVAYWLPVDAEKDNNQNWISADDIGADTHAIPSNHILIVSDSCFSGELARDADVGITPHDRSTYLAKLAQSKSRNLMSSGGNEPVADGGAPGHSVFASAVLDSLTRIDDNIFTAAELFGRFIQPAVAGSADQVPQYGVIRKSGHNYGEFVFSRLPDKNAKGSRPTVHPPADGNVSANTNNRSEEPATKPSAGKTKVPREATPAASFVANNSNPDININLDHPGTPPSLVKKSPPTIPTTVPAQRFSVAHFSSIDPKELCIGWLTIDNGVVRFQGLKGTHGVHNFEFPSDAIKEIKQNALILSAIHAFHIRTNGGDVQNFSLIDSQSGIFLSPDLLLNAAHVALAK